MISSAQRDVLIDHLDGPCAVVLPGTGIARGDAAVAIGRRWQTTSRLLMAGYLRGDPGGAARPRRTVMTFAGRAVLAQALAAMAEILVAAGYGLEPPAGWPEVELKPSLTLPRLSFRGHEDAPST
jgi:hypothetical protein